MKKRTALGWSLAGMLIACSPDNATVPKAAEEAFKELGLALDVIPPGQDIPFIPVASSATCSVGGPRRSAARAAAGLHLLGGRQRRTRLREQRRHEHGE